MDYVIIGGSAAGISCIESIRELDRKSAITLIGEEEFPLYSRCLLSYFLAGAIPEANLHFREADFFERNNVRALMGVRAEKIDTGSRTVVVRSKDKIRYDKLLIATGARSKMLDLPGIEKKGVCVLRTVEDARGILALLTKVRTAAVLGGGLIGLKGAYALSTRGVKVKIVVKSSQLLSQVLDSKAAEIVQGRVEREGIDVMKGLEAKEISGKGEATGIMLDNGKTLDCELVLIGKGVEPNVELAKNAGIAVRQGITVSANLQTSAPGVFAAGDCVETRDISSGELALNALWPCAAEQGKAAGRNMAGKETLYDGSLGMNSVEFFGVPVISMGITRPKGAGYEELAAADMRKGIYKKVVLKGDVIRGFIAVGRIENSGVYNLLIRNEITITKIKESLLDPDFNYAKAMPLILEYRKKFNKDEFQDSLLTY